MRFTFCLALGAVVGAGALPAQADIVHRDNNSRAAIYERACQSPKIEMVDAQLLGGSGVELPTNYLRHIDDAVFFYFSPVEWRTPRFAVAQFTLHRDGRVSGTRLVTPSTMANFDSALTAAIASAATTKAIAAIPSSVTADSLVFSLYAGRHADGGDKPYLEKRTTCPAWPLADNPQPQYPPDMKSQDVRGFVRMQFMVDEDGNLDLNTVQVLQSSGDPFTEAVRAILPSLRYKPASVQGTKIRQLTEQTFTFGFAYNQPAP
ncbi:MAG TPA: energy transducer TonB [Gemmatimonadaceae bacterium]|nr:energy transducer TonB [Gemmatimonadaceae bacterium]